MRSLFFFPPLPKISGGMAVIVHMAVILHESGFDVAIVVREPCPALCLIAPGVPVLPWEQLVLASTDLWVVPEGWPNALVPGLQAGARCLVYVQNWAFLLGNLPQAIAWKHLPVSYVAVSHPVAWFVRETVGVLPEILRPGIDLTRFHPVLPAPSMAPPLSKEKKLRIAWMPRKNKALAHQIRHIFEARRLLKASLPSDSPVEWVEIHGRTQQEVATLLRSSHIFLATGFPEGCPLPPLEAMACGCLVVGFNGFGGWDYMRQALPAGSLPYVLPHYAANTTQATAPEVGNGFFVADADVMGAAMALEHATAILQADGEELHHVRAAAAATAQRYSLEAQKARVLALWEQAARKRLWTVKSVCASETSQQKVEP